MSKKVIVVVGCGDSGRAAVRAALRSSARPNVVLIERANCEAIEGAQVFPNSEALEIIPEDKLVKLKSKRGSDTLKYDALIIATGSQPIIPKNLIKEGVIAAKTALSDSIPEMKNISFYGLSTCGLSILEKIKNRNIIVIEPEKEILLGILDPPLASRVREFLSSKGVKFFMEERIEKVYGYERISGIETESGFKPTDLLIVDLGVVPRGGLLHGIVRLGLHGGIPTDMFQGVGVEDIYACGSCAEVNDAALGVNRPIPTAEVSRASGMVAGYNAAGLKIAARGYVRKMWLNLHGLEITSVGITEAEAKRYEIPYETFEASFKNALVKVIIEKSSRRLMGVQGLGPSSPTIPECIALVIKGYMTVYDLFVHNLEFSTQFSTALHLALEEAIK